MRHMRQRPGGFAQINTTLQEGAMIRERQWNLLLFEVHNFSGMQIKNK